MAETTIRVTVVVQPFRVTATLPMISVVHRVGVASNVDQTARDAATNAQADAASALAAATSASTAATAAQGVANAAQADATAALDAVGDEATTRADADADLQTQINGKVNAAGAAAAAPVQSVAGRTGAVTLAVADVTGAEATANKGTANGYASLDGATKLPAAQLPGHQATHRVGGSDALPTGDATTPGLLKLGAAGGAQAYSSILDGLSIPRLGLTAGIYRPSTGEATAAAYSTLVAAGIQQYSFEVQESSAQYDAIAVNQTNASGAGKKFRIVVRAVDATTGLPGALLWYSADQAADGANGVKALTFASGTFTTLGQAAWKSGNNFAPALGAKFWAGVETDAAASWTISGYTAGNARPISRSAGAFATGAMVKCTTADAFVASTPPDPAGAGTLTLTGAVPAILLRYA